MSYDSDYTNPSDSKNRFVQSHQKISPKKCIVISLGKFDFWLDYSSDYSYIGILFSTLTDALVTNAIMHKGFLPLKVYMAISVFFWAIQVYIFLWLAQHTCQVTLLAFYIIPGGFSCLPDAKFTPRPQPRKFW